MNKSNKKVPSIIALLAVACFFLGFITAQTMEKTKWVGYLVHGVKVHVDKSIFPEPSGYSPTVDSQIVLGLREDGVVVWKHVADTTAP